MSHSTNLLSIIICAYNERRTILEAIEQARRVDLGSGWDQEVIVVDNYSTDGTRELLQTVDLPGVRVVFHSKNLGKSASINPANTVAVFGSRTLGGRKIYEYAENYWGVRLLTWLANRFFGGRLTDIAVGLKLARVDVIRSIDFSAQDFDFDFELPCELLKRGYEIKEIPVAYHPRTAEQGKGLVGMKAFHTGFRWLLILLKARFSGFAGTTGRTR